MARRDIYHEHVKEALINDGWEVTHDPYQIKVGGIYQEIDLGAEKLIAAEREKEALGKFRNYSRALRQKEPDRILFLAVPENVYNKFFQKPFIQEAVIEEELHLIVYSTTEAIIISWIK
jgi:nicotinamide riboside kinase